MLTAFFKSSNMNKAANIVGSSIIGTDFKTVVIKGKAYTIYPPTIKKIAGASCYLSKIEEGNTLKDMFINLGNLEAVSYALSWFIQGDDSLSKELSNGSIDELADALEMAYSLISAEHFFKLSALARNVALLTAKQK